MAARSTPQDASAISTASVAASTSFQRPSTLSPIHGATSLRRENQPEAAYPHESQPELKRPLPELFGLDDIDAFRPGKLPKNFQDAIQNPYAKQQKRKLKTQMLPDPSLGIPIADYVSFLKHLKSSDRILALLGAGLSAGSGVPTFRGAGATWRGRISTELSSPYTLNKDPVLFWHFFNYRRHVSLRADPNPAHYALAELGKSKPEFLAITQNVDGLSQRAKHEAPTLQPVHGSLFDIKCCNTECEYTEKDNIVDPIVPALGASRDVANPNVSLPPVSLDDLPHCPECNHLLRPAVVLFEEPLPQSALKRIDRWMFAGDVDLMLVIGTSACVWPAAGYIDMARRQGARIAVINLEDPDDGSDSTHFREEDWFFKGDAARIVPELLKEVIGKIPDQ